MSEDIFRQLQQKLDSYSLGFPKTATGIEITILKKLFSQKDAEMFLNISAKMEDPESVAHRLGRPVEEVTEQLEDMARRNLIIRIRKGESVKYGAIPYIHGLAEFGIEYLDRDMGLLFDQYVEEQFHQALAGVNGLFNRTIPIDKSIDPEHHVMAFDDVRSMLRTKDTIVVTDCLCRKTQKLLGKGCGKPLETCFVFGSMAQFYIENKIGRRVSAEEAIELVRIAQEAGLVTQPATTQNPGGICNCCGDCCIILRSVKKFPKPAERVFSNYQVAVDAEKCTGSKVCLRRCPMGANSMNKDGISQVDLDRCIGCGLCVVTCESGARKLIPKPEAKRRIPPETVREQADAIAKYRGLI